MLKYSAILFFFAILAAWAAKPMEPLTNYNVIMVHGAAAADEGIKDDKVEKNVCNNKAYDKYGGVWGSANAQL